MRLFAILLQAAIIESVYLIGILNERKDTPMKIIDSHVHVVQYIAGTGSRGELRSIGGGKAMYADGSVMQMIPEEFHDDKVTPEKIIELMDEAGIAQAVLLQGNFYGFQNLYTYEAMKKYPERFGGAASYDPFSRNKESICAHLFDECKFKAVKFEVSTGSGLMSNHFTLPLNGEIMDREYAYASQKNLTFVIDIGKCGSESWQVKELREAALRYPEMKFVVCHLLAASMNQEERLREGLSLLKLPNVWFDLASVPHNCMPDAYPYENARRYYSIAKSIVGAERLMFGTDAPSNLREDTYEHFVRHILDWDGFTEQEKEYVFYKNAEMLYFNK